MNDRSWFTARWLGNVALVVAVCTGYALAALPLGWAAVAALGRLSHSAAYALGLAGVLALFFAWMAGLALGYAHVRDNGRGRFVVALEAYAFGVLVAWGLGVNHWLLRASCRVTNCDVGEPFRALAEPEVAGLAALHAAVALAYAVSRRRPEALRPLPEALVHGTMIAGLALHGALAVQFADGLPLGVVAAPFGLPVIAPYVTLVLLARELVARLRRRGAEVPAPPRAPDADGVYRAAPELEAPALRPAVHVPTLLRGLALAPAVLGAYAVLQTAWLHGADAALRVFTRTCGHALSRVPVETVVVHDCHYLCTVAAGGHPWLVKPERVGRRNGHPIVVNRQLAVANAFEDLLHTRWPRFGRACRRAYDRLGLPVSRYIRRRWMADAVYLAMKPLEWCFYAALLALDPGDPERRIDRMYR